MSSQHVWFRKHQDSYKTALPPLCVCTAITTYNSTPLPSSNYSVKKATTSWQSPNSRHWLAATDLSLLSLACHLCSKAESYLKQKQTPSLLYSMILTFSWQIFFFFKYFFLRLPPRPGRWRGHLHHKRHIMATGSSPSCLTSRWADCSFFLFPY